MSELLLFFSPCSRVKMYILYTLIGEWGQFRQREEIMKVRKLTFSTSVRQKSTVVNTLYNFLEYL